MRGKEAKYAERGGARTGIENLCCSSNNRARMANSGPGEPQPSRVQLQLKLKLNLPVAS